MLNIKNILVTGATGFIASHLVEELLKREVAITVPYIELNPQSYFVKKELDHKVNLVKTDITNREAISKLIKDNKIDFIFHLAAVTIVTEAYNDPFTTFNTNIMGTVNLLECVRNNANIKGMIFASSDKAYGKTTQEYTEDFPLKGDHPYDVSKSSADLIAQAYFKTFKTPVVISRFANVYGEGDLHFNRIIPGICEAVCKKQLLEIRSDGTFIRDYIYVKDVVSGYLTLFDIFEKVKGEAFNFSSTDSLSVIDVVKTAEDALGVTIPYKILNTAKNEIPYQHLDDSKIQKHGWKSKNTLQEVLPRVLTWYKSYFNSL